MFWFWTIHTLDVLKLLQETVDENWIPCQGRTSLVAKKFSLHISRLGEGVSFRLGRFLSVALLSLSAI